LELTTIMGEFLQQLLTWKSISQMAFFAGIIASLSFGIVGSYVVARRISYIAAAIAHCVLGGIGAAVFIQHKLGWTWFDPMLGALIAAILAALIIGVVSLYLKEREDTIISATWSVGMSLGFLFLYFSPNFQGNLESFLMGSILYISPRDLWITLALGIAVITLSLLFYNKLLAVCFDGEFAQLRGINTPVYYFMLLILTALSVVLLVQLTGVVLAIALIVLPAATGMRFAKRLWHAMIIAIVLAMIFTSLGLGLSYTLEWPTGPVIVILAALVYTGTLIGKSFRKA
jgi:zinc transport system permease protein